MAVKHHPTTRRIHHFYPQRIARGSLLQTITGVMAGFTHLSKTPIRYFPINRIRHKDKLDSTAIAQKNDRSQLRTQPTQSQNRPKNTRFNSAEKRV
jgi:hypothetical protein